LRVPQDRMGRFSTELFERYQRSERALVAALAEVYVQRVSTRKVKAICVFRSNVITITGIGDHLRPEWLITITGIRRRSPRSCAATALRLPRTVQ
jgi:hypothetical protein